MIIGLALMVAVVALVGLGIRRLTSRPGAEANDGRGVRRFFQYLLLYGLMIVAAIGLSGLLGMLLAGRDVGRAEQARYLTFSIIGLPLFVVLAVWSRRRLREDRGEPHSFGWLFYSTVAPLTALVMAMTAFYDVAAWVFQARSYDGEALAGVIVWGGLWLGHWLVTSRLGEPARSPAHHVLGSAIGLGTGATGLVWMLGSALDVFFDTGGGVIFGLGSEIGRAAAVAVTGILVWVVYWLSTLADEPRTPLWFGYVLPFGVGGGLVMVIGAASVVLYDVLVWFWGRPLFEASIHFSGATTAVATLLVGGLVWWYHRQVLEEAGAAERNEVRRVYEYLIAGIALLAAAGGMVTVIVAVIEALAGPGAVEVGTSAINTLLAAITLLVVGGPVWWIFWRGIQRAATAEPRDELTSPTRRIYLFVLFGIGGVAAVISLLIGVFLVIEDVLEGRFGSETMRDVRVTVGLLATTGAIAGYHWAVYREDRRIAPEHERRGPRYVLLIGDADPSVERAVSAATGARVDLWPRADGVAGPWSVDDLTAALAAVVSEEVTVVSGPEGIQVIAVDRR